MSTIVKIPMNEEQRVSLEDCFIDIPNMDARKFMFDNLKLACQDAKRSVRNKVTNINQRSEEGMMKQEEYSLKGIDFSKYVLKSNPAWIPKNGDPEDNTPIELKLGDNTMKYLNLFGSIVLIRHEQFNKSEDKFLETARAKMLATNPPKENMEQWESAQKKMREDRLGVVPTCLEDAIHTSIWPLVQQKIDQSDSQMFDKEYQEEYKPAEPDAKPAK